MSGEHSLADWRVVAVAPELRGLRSAFELAWPVDETLCFQGLLEEADRSLSDASS